MTTTTNHVNTNSFSQINALDSFNLFGGSTLAETAEAFKNYAAEDLTFLKHISKQGSPFQRAAANVILQELGL